MTLENGASFGERSEPNEKPQPEPDVKCPRKSLETNPSLTYGSTTSLVAVLLDSVLDIVEPDRIVFLREIEALTSVTL